MHRVRRRRVARENNRPALRWLGKELNDPVELFKGRQSAGTANGEALPGSAGQIKRLPFLAASEVDLQLGTGARVHEAKNAGWIAGQRAERGIVKRCEAAEFDGRVEGHMIRQL